MSNKGKLSTYDVMAEKIITNDTQQMIKSLVKKADSQLHFPQKVARQKRSTKRVLTKLLSSDSNTNESDKKHPKIESNNLS